MYIQKINIKNFKSFKDETIIPFCEGLNIINGANGSGKSNFINSIRFVLCDLENSKNIIRTNEKECSVEIIFNGEEEKIILEKRITQNEDNSFTESFFHNRQQVSKQIYETARSLTSALYASSEGNPIFLAKVSSTLGRAYFEWSLISKVVALPASSAEP